VEKTRLSKERLCLLVVANEKSVDSSGSGAEIEPFGILFSIRSFFGFTFSSFDFHGNCERQQCGDAY